MIKVLHVVGNDMELGNGIGRLIPEMIINQNKKSKLIKSSLMLLSKCDVKFEFECYFFNEIGSNLNFYKSFDLVIFHGIYFWNYLKIASFIKNNNIPYCVKPHSSLMKIAQKKSRVKKMIANILFYNNFINKSNGILYTNKDEEFNSKYFNINSLIEANGIDFPYMEPSREQHTGNNKKTFIYLSRIDFNHKGIDVLLDALNILIDRGFSNDFEFRFYGKGSPEDEKKLKTIIKKMDCLSIGFYGASYGEAKIKAFLNSDVFVLTSRYEGFPMAILEAMHQKLPCLVTPGTNISEILSNFDVGWLVDFDPIKIADKIETIIKTPQNLISLKGDNARRYVLEQHNWEKLVRESEQAYKVMIHRGAS